MAMAERKRTERYRQKLRAAGLRPMQIWIPDVNRPGFSSQLRRQLSRLRGQPEERGTLDFIETLERDEHGE